MPRPSKLTAELRQAIVDKYQQGSTIPKLEMEFRLSRPTLSKILKEAGIIPIRKDNLFTPKPIGEDIEEKIVQDYKDGESINKLQHKYNIPFKAVEKILSDHGIEREKRSFPPPEETKSIKTKDGTDKTFLGQTDQRMLVDDFINNNFPKKDLADKYNVSLETVDNTLQRNGVPSSWKRDVLNSDLEKEILEEFKKGELSIFNLGKLFRIHPSIIRFILQKNGIDPESVKPTKKTTAQRVKELLKNASLDIAQELIDDALDTSGVIQKKEQQLIRLAILDRAWGKAVDEKDEEESEGKEEIKRLKSVPSSVKNKITHITGGNK